MLVVLVLMLFAVMFTIVYKELRKLDRGWTPTTFTSRLDTVQQEADLAAQQIHDATSETLRQMTDYVVRRNFPHDGPR